MVQGGMSCIKYLLAFFNFLFLICGIVMVVVGGIVQHEISPYNLSATNLTAAPALLIAVGVFIFLLSFLGCCGAVKENHTMVMMFSVLLSLILVLEIAAMVAGFIFSHKVEGSLSSAMDDSMSHYETDKTTRSIWDATQHDFKCCGVSNYTDWEHKNISVPASCCDTNTNENGTCDPKQYYKDGCLVALEKLLSGKVYIVGSVALVIALIELMGIICGCYLAQSIRRQYEMV